MEKKNQFVLEMHPDNETEVSIYNDHCRIDLLNIGEGYHGDYDPDDPEDMNLLRFDVYKNENDRWVDVEDASYCTMFSANASEAVLILFAQYLLKEYTEPVKLGYSLKHFGEAYSWMSENDFKLKIIHANNMEV